MKTVCAYDLVVGTSVPIGTFFKFLQRVLRSNLPCTPKLKKKLESKIEISKFSAFDRTEMKTVWHMIGSSALQSLQGLFSNFCREFYGQTCHVHQNSKKSQRQKLKSQNFPPSIGRQCVHMIGSSALQSPQGLFSNFCREFYGQTCHVHQNSKKVRGKN